MRTRLIFAACAAALTLSLIPKAAAQADFKNWPKGSSPSGVGKRVAERFVASPHFNFMRPTPPRTITYPETCTWYGALTFAKVSKDRELTKKLVAHFEPLFGPEASLIPSADHVDPSVFGAVPFELYIQTRDARYLPVGKRIADRQWAPPTEQRLASLKPEDRQRVEQAVKEGLSQQTRFWIDDMYMITALQAQAFRATGDRTYIDRAGREMAAYLDRLQQPNGLFYHAPDVPFFWGRGNGWMAAGMAELLRSLPKDHPNRARVREGYRKMMATLLKHQGADGMWRQLIDRPESWPETSSTGMFTFAMVTGVKEGWLDRKTYGPAARKGWLALVKYINADGDISEVCEGTNKKNDYQYYMDRKRNVGDLHGQAPILWSATAFLR
ncbi:MAG TPA: glycoside hydrolase family 88 protein [Pyrinomonadaceae bacterium]|nr:glycoside hydrolase family 88 protein [Pyrinomonadaceae bacterium]